MQNASGKQDKIIKRKFFEEKKKSLSNFSTDTSIPQAITGGKGNISVEGVYSVRASRVCRGVAQPVQSFFILGNASQSIPFQELSGEMNGFCSGTITKAKLLVQTKFCSPGRAGKCSGATMSSASGLELFLNNTAEH